MQEAHTGKVSIKIGAHTNKCTLLLHPHLPADRVKLGDVLCHVFVHVKSVDDGVDFECHFVLLAPVANLVKVVQVALPALSSANQLVGGFIETVTRDCQNVQIVT